MKNLLPHFIHEQQRRGRMHGHFQAFTMFIDLSGFTPLTDTLMKRGNEGAEQLSLSLNNIFAPMVREVYLKEGFIPYFAGDAFTAIFPYSTVESNASEMMATAQRIRNLIEREGLKRTKFGAFQIGIKLGLSFGDVEWGIVGDTYKTFYFRGSAVDGAVEAQELAVGQQIVFDESFREMFKASGIEAVKPGFYQYAKEFPLEEEPTEDPVLPLLKHKVARLFLPKEVIAFDQEGEFRPVVSVFISFCGVDTHQQLNDFTTVVLNQVGNFSGYLKELEFGDKGGVIAIFFGAPVSFENNEYRALECILSIEKTIKDNNIANGLRYRVGITSGVAYTGIVGGRERCQYAAVGNRVNLAARLMVYADWGEVLVDEGLWRVKAFQFQNKGEIHYKGISGDIPTYKLTGRSLNGDNGFAGEIIGRDKELEWLCQFASPIFDFRFAGIARVYGEAGIGKSRLSFELKKALQLREEISWFICPADQILRKSFNPFIYFLKNYFNQPYDQSALNNIQKFEKQFGILIDKLAYVANPEAETIRKELLRTKSILAGMVGIHYENSLWEQLDAKGRFDNELAALTNLLLGESLIQPVVLVLEDAHWYDNTSKDFLNAFARRIKNFPLFILVTSRYNDDGSKPVLFEQEVMEEFQLPLLEIDLNMLPLKALKLFAEKRLGGNVSQHFIQLLHNTTNGNPFYTEQLLEYFSESKLLTQRKGKWHLVDDSIRLSSSINGILMARIDRLSNMVKETVKAAAVIGREFEIPVLTEVLRQNHALGNDIADESTLYEQIATAEKGQIWRATNELNYMFHHSLLREAVYDMQLRTRLRQLHMSIARAIEKLYADNIEERYYDLAFHYEQAEMIEKTNEYLKKAANYAINHFQNQQALRLYGKLIANYKQEGNDYQVIRTLLLKAKVEEMIGQWEDCEATCNEALYLARAVNDKLLIGRANNSLGSLLLLRGNYEDARMYLEVAATFFDDIDDARGKSEVYGNLGDLFFRQGEYDEAKAFFTKSIEIARENPAVKIDPHIVSNLGLTHMNQGNFDEGIGWLRQQLEEEKRSLNKPGMATLLVNMGIIYIEKGDYNSALQCLEEGVPICEELGNRQLYAIGIGCMGIVHRHNGDYKRAMGNFVQDLALCQDLGDKQGTAIALGLVGELYTTMGEFNRAVEYLEKKMVLSSELGYQKGIAQAVNALADVYAFQRNYEKSLVYYKQAVRLTRAINNRLILGFSLSEKADVLLRLGRVEKAQLDYQEAFTIAEELQNEDLLHEVRILGAKVAHALNETNLAVKQLEQLLAKSTEKSLLAGTYYELSKIQPENSFYCQKALALYKEVYKITPKYLFKLRIEALEKKKSSS